MNITETFAHHARAVPDRPAIVHGDKVLLYRDLDPLVSRIAAHLRAQGLAHGEVAGVALKDSVEHLLILAALARAGIVILPLDWRWTPAEQERVVTHFGASRVLVEAGRPQPAGVPCSVIDAAWMAAAARESAGQHFSDDDLPLLMSLSSGTTGRPKGPRIRHSQFLARYRVFWINLGFNSQDRFLSATPLYYGGGRTFPLMMLYSGATVVMLPPPHEPDELCAALLAHRITALFLVPTLIRRLLTLPGAQLAPLSTLRLLLSSGSALHGEERRTLRALCPGFVEYYSSTEGGGVSFLSAADPQSFSDSVGRPVFGVEVQCVDEENRPQPPGSVGRIRYRGPAVADGFWNDEEASREAFRDGWWYPGDLGMLDAHGYLYLKGRAKDMIIRGGVNIYPGEIEAVLQAHPAVADCAVVGWPSREFNEEVAAFVILKDAVTALELRESCKGKMAPYKLPREVFVVKDFPRNALGKVIKADLGASLPSL